MLTRILLTAQKRPNFIQNLAIMGYEKCSPYIWGTNLLYGVQHSGLNCLRFHLPIDTLPVVPTSQKLDDTILLKEAFMSCAFYWLETNSYFRNGRRIYGEQAIVPHKAMSGLCSAIHVLPGT